MFKVGEFVALPTDLDGLPNFGTLHFLRFEWQGFLMSPWVDCGSLKTQSRHDQLLTNQAKGVLCFSWFDQEYS